MSYSSLDLRDLSKLNYSKLGLSSNPFPSMALPDEIPSIIADRKEILEKFHNSLRDCVSTGNTHLTVLTGDYGSGKSHTLKYLKYEVNRQLLQSNENKVIAIYVKSIGLEISDFYKYFIDDLGRQFLTQIAEKIIKQYLGSISEDARKKYVYAPELKKKDLSKVKLEEYLRGSQFYDVFRQIRNNVLSEISNNDLVFGLLHLAHPDYAPIAWRWMLGEDVDKDSRKAILIDKKIDDKIQIQNIFTDIISLLLNFEKIKGVVILIDEFENVTNISKITRDRYFDEIRHMLDENRKGIYYVVATTLTGLDAVVKSSSALSRRFSRDLPLKKFGIDDIHELIKNYLSLYRLKDFDIDSKITSGEISKKYYPFTNSAMSLIDECTLGVVHNIIDVCRDAVEIAAHEEKEIIDKDTIESVIANFD
jgi:type II secretory pathway predicted ATPase ExeA